MVPTELEFRVSGTTMSYHGTGDRLSNGLTNDSLLSAEYVACICDMDRRFARLLVTWAALRALPRAGSRMPTSSAMIAITTSSSISVNARMAFLDMVRTSCLPQRLEPGRAREPAAPPTIPSPPPAFPTLRFCRPYQY